MAKKNRPRRRKSKPARAARVAQAFPASVAAAEFLAICSEAAQRGQTSNPSAAKDSERSSQRRNILSNGAAFGQVQAKDAMVRRDHSTAGCPRGGCDVAA
jgi:hypothetical protein